MSRIGKQPITIPEGVTLDVNGQDVKAITALYDKWLSYLAPKSFINAIELS